MTAASSATQNAIDALRREIEHEGGRPQIIDTLISDLTSNRDAEIAAALLSLLSDRASYDEGMFSIIHAAEATDDAAYVAGLLKAFASLAAAAPRWASIVLMRVLNDAASRHELIRQLREAPVSIKESVRDMSGRINAVSPEFLNRTTPVILAAQ
jgi:hypothetical protein